MSSDKGKAADGRRSVVGLVDVARHAQVSPATVSRVLLGGARVARKTRERVLESVRVLGYQPNSLASSLRRGRGRNVALVTGDIQHGIYAALAKHLQLRLETVGLDLLLFNLEHQEERLRDLLRRSVSLGLRGLLLASADIMDMEKLLPLVEDVQESGVNVISVSQRLDAAGIVSIVHDDAAGAAVAVEHLAKTGRKHIAFLGRVDSSAVGRERFVGYRRGLEAAGLPFREDLVLDIQEGYRAEAGYARVGAVLRAGLRIDAALAASDELALGGMAAARDAGHAVPEEIGFVGFGGLDWGRFTRPALTTVELDIEALAEAVGACFSALDAGETFSDLTLIAPQLTVNDSA